MANTSAFAALEAHQYINLATFRKTGAAVPTPVWFALEGDCLYILTIHDSGKVKRIRNNPQVTMVPSDSRGSELAGTPTLSGNATIVPFDKQGPGHRALRAKYGWMYSAFGLIWQVRRLTPVIIEVRP
ncbi:MAG: PPOX class F420-dependent oxidoreductase [Candidatus Viridilinea halotolerans]|uniref:PPOX class F420-dependent oxidoreductase n=1 Tax=Candidatus Viridilinea halotolerans TaxID=2491704 RepID=A0A426TVW1_9CHLR|nr:MAG: PPOX class F420-dependent oxidoreductase [Candidatus Viridilinea halotolerans]